MSGGDASCLQPCVLEPTRVILAPQLRTGAVLAGEVECRTRASDPDEGSDNDADKGTRVEAARVHGRRRRRRRRSRPQGAG